MSPKAAQPFSCSDSLAVGRRAPPELRALPLGQLPLALPERRPAPKLKHRSSRTLTRPRPL
eukprot:7216356-Alexandrium_andersonii.AAC.1